MGLIISQVMGKLIWNKDTLQNYLDHDGGKGYLGNESCGTGDYGSHGRMVKIPNPNKPSYQFRAHYPSTSHLQIQEMQSQET